MTPVFAQWRYMVECGQFTGHLWEFPHCRNYSEWELNGLNSLVEGLSGVDK